MSKKLKVYDFDRSYDTADGVDELGEYVIRELDRELYPFGIALMTNGLSTHTYKIMQEVEG